MYVACFKFLLWFIFALHGLLVNKPPAIYCMPEMTCFVLKWHDVFCHFSTTKFSFETLGSLKVHKCRFENLPISSSSYENNMWRRLHIKAPFTFWDMRKYDMWKTCLKTLAYFLRILQTSRASKSRIIRVKNVKFSRYYFYLNTII